MSSLLYSRWRPTVETSLIDVEGQYEDMWNAYDFFDRFIKEFNSKDFLLLDALASAAVIRYGRSFGPGVRARLNIEGLPDVTVAELELHTDLIEIRSKHVAHPVNRQETHAVYVGHSESGIGERQVTCVSSGTLTATAISIDVASAAQKLCMRWVEWLNQRRGEETERLIVVARELTTTEILALPTGPEQLNPNPLKVRTKPK